MKRAFIILVAIVSLISCGKKEVKQETYESKKAQEAFAASEAIRNAYLNRDLSSVEKNTTKEGYREFIGAVKSFDKADLTFEPKWVEIEDSTVSLKIAWSGKWVVKGQETEERGLAIFVLEGNPLKLNRILGSNPFRQPE